MYKTLRKPNVLICSYAFWPSLGGLELTSEKLAFWLSQNGYDVSVITFTPLGNYSERENMPFNIIRRPSLLQQLKIFTQSDIIISKGLSNKCCWPMLFLNKKFLIWHAGLYKKNENIINSILRKKLINVGISVANSRSTAVQNKYRYDAIVYPGYSENVYIDKTPWEKRTGLIYLGRLSHDKGCDVLIEAIKNIPDINLKIIGDGPERNRLEQLAQTLGVNNRVNFVGRLEPLECNELLNTAKVLVVPSRHEEGFGTVALEGLASGCRVVVSNGGGLPEAVGSTGFIFQMNNIGDIVECIKKALNSPITQTEIDAKKLHLKNNTFNEIAQQLISLATNKRD